MVVSKICALVFATGAQLYSITPPNTTPGPKERLKVTGTELIAPRMPIFAKGFLCGCALAEIAFATGHEPSISKSLTSLSIVRSDTFPDFDPAVLSPALVAGSFLSIFGAAFRFYCYRTLGRLFTFELSIRQNHTLVTSGPYSIVRHPSYTALLCVCLGILVCHFHTRSWLVSRSGLFPSSGQVVMWTQACIWGTFSVLCSVIRARIQKEETMLEGHFGDQWRRYMKEVPYRLVPWLY